LVARLHSAWFLWFAILLKQQLFSQRSPTGWCNSAIYFRSDTCTLVAGLAALAIKYWMQRTHINKTQKMKLSTINRKMLIKIFHIFIWIIKKHSIRFSFSRIATQILKYILSVYGWNSNGKSLALWIRIVFLIYISFCFSYFSIIFKCCQH
jgi:hypothetical protein